MVGRLFEICLIGVSMARTKLSPVVVSDAGPLIHLDELDCLELLSDFTVWVPNRVCRDSSALH